MKIIITGASGNVGRSLVEFFTRNEVELLLVGRDINKLNKIFPNYKCCNYDELKKSKAFFDALIHLAVINNNSRSSFREFKKINSDFLNSIAKLAVKKKIKYFINFNSFHNLDINNRSFYAESKREGTKKISKLKKIKIINLYLPFVNSGVWSGKLTILNIFPVVISKLIFSVLSAIKPSVNADTIHKKIMKLLNSNLGGDFLVAEDIEKNNVYKLFNKVIDFTFLITIFLLTPLLLIVYLAILLLEKNNPIFSQKRVGKHKKNFVCYKFKTMNENTPEKGTHEITVEHITKLGYVLRKFKIDELPQVLNIFKGDMTLIGPRPCLVSQNSLIENRNNLKVYDITPGITGLSQVNGIDMSDSKVLAESDYRYKKMRCIYLDIKIILQTIFKK